MRRSVVIVVPFICEREISGLYRFRADPDLFRFWVPRDRLGPGVSRKPADPVTLWRWGMPNVQRTLGAAATHAATPQPPSIKMSGGRGGKHHNTSAPRTAAEDGGEAEGDARAAPRRRIERDLGSGFVTRAGFELLDEKEKAAELHMQLHQAWARDKAIAAALTDMSRCVLAWN